MTHTDLLRRSLDALEALQGGCTDSDDGTVEVITVWCPELIDDIRAALAQPAIDGFGGNLDSAFDAPAVPADEFEVRADGEKVRKDRWEWGIRRIVALLWGNRQAFEVDEVVDAVRGLVPTPNDDDESLCATVQNNYVAPDVPTPDYITTIEVLRAHIAALESAAPAVPAECCRNELLTALHSLASNYENALGMFGQDGEGRRKAEGDLAHAMKVAAKHNRNGPGCAAPAVPDVEEALAAYWDAAYTEGRQGRTHDTPDGAAQRALRAVRKAIAAPAVREPLTEDCPPNHFCNRRFVHLPRGEQCERCGHE